jgi:hypothetical protein
MDLRNLHYSFSNRFIFRINIKYSIFELVQNALTVRIQPQMILIFARRATPKAALTQLIIAHDNFDF